MRLNCRSLRKCVCVSVCMSMCLCVCNLFILRKICNLSCGVDLILFPFIKVYLFHEYRKKRESLGLRCFPDGSFGSVGWIDLLVVIAEPQPGVLIFDFFFSFILVYTKRVLLQDWRYPPILSCMKNHRCHR